MKKLWLLIFFACACGAKEERVYYPVLNNSLATINMVDVDAGPVYLCPKDVDKFEPINFEGDDKNPPGILINECQFAQENIQDTKDLKTLRKQVIVIKKKASVIQGNIDNAERTYQDRIYDLKDACQKTWWDNNKGYVLFTLGFVAGIVISAVAVTAIDFSEDLDTP